MIQSASGPALPHVDVSGLLQVDQVAVQILLLLLLGGCVCRLYVFVSGQSVQL